MKILLYDIETSPNLGYTWEKYEQNVLSFVRDREILCFAYKWLGSKNVTVVSREGQKDDKYVVKVLHTLFQEADIVVAHNNDKFDQGVAKARMIYHGMNPPRIMQSVDTCKAAKNYFKFNSNSLGDLGQYLRLGAKQKHSGFDMWLGCMADKASSWKEMKSYNKQDVILLEKVYLRLRPWIVNHPRTSSISTGCPHGPNHDVYPRGYRATQATIKRQMYCKDCNIWYLTSIKKVK